MCPQLANIILVAAFVKCLHVNLAYKESHSDTSARRNRPQNIIWYNPPYSKKVETNIGKRFLSLIDLHFPKSNPLHKIFNRNTIKLSYSCMPNVRTIISNHNKSELNKPEQTDFIKNCNCWNSKACPMNGNCNEQGIVYQAEISTPTTMQTYIGLCDTTFKLRYRNNMCSFKNKRYKHATELSKYIWSLKGKNVKYTIKWRKVKQAKEDINVTKKCNLCLWEKYFRIGKPEMSTLNNRYKLISGCRHSEKFLLNTVPTWFSFCRKFDVL